MSSTPDDPRSSLDETRAAPRIIRRHPTGSIPVSRPDETRTHIIRRAPANPEAPTSLIPPPVSPKPVTAKPAAAAVPGTAVATAAVSIFSGWPAAVVAADLIADRWGANPVFCVAVGFLTLLFAATTVSGVILLLLRRPLGRYLIAFGSAVALLTSGSVFLAGAHSGWLVYAMPALPVAALVLTTRPETRRWCHG